MTTQTGPDGRPIVLDNFDDWLAQRNAHLQRLAAGAHAAGHEAWVQANRVGRYLDGSQPSDVAALGARAMQQVNPKSLGVARTTVTVGSGRVTDPPPKKWDTARGVENEVIPALNGAQDAFTFGLGDRAYAGVRAIADAARGEDLPRSYARHYAGTQALDGYDATHHPIARTMGQLAGTGAQIALTGGGEGLIAAGGRISQVAPRLARESAALVAGGALAGVGGQALSDVLEGRTGTAGDYGGAALGGSAGILAMRLSRARTTYGGAAAGAVTSATQDILNGRPVSLDGARQTAAIGGGIGGLGSVAGRAWSKGLSNAEKGDLGEALSRLRTAARGDRTLPGGKSRAYLNSGRYTYPDQRTQGGELVESKFGVSARLSPRQREAYRQPLSGYRVDGFVPSDIGMAFGLPSAALAYRLDTP